MKFIEIAGGVVTPVSNEELVLLEKIKGSGKPYPKSLLDERQRELARQMVTRGVLTRLLVEDKICFVYNDLEDLWET